MADVVVDIGGYGDDDDVDDVDDDGCSGCVRRVVDDFF